MSHLLSQLRTALRSDPYLDQEKSPLLGLGVYHCHKLQKLRAVPILQPMIMLVVTGHKKITMDDRTFTIRSGELFVSPPDMTLLIKKNPDPRLNDYQAMSIGFSLETLDHFRQVYGPDLEHWEITPKWHEKAPESILVGYQSQSRFGERFKRRFGLTPSELRRTRLPDGGENLTVLGESS